MDGVFEKGTNAGIVHLSSIRDDLIAAGREDGHKEAMLAALTDDTMLSRYMDICQSYFDFWHDVYQDYVQRKLKDKSVPTKGD